MASIQNVVARIVPAEQGSAVRRGSVLVVDDEDLVRLVIARRLRHSGFEVREARDGLDALASASLARPDAVLTDLNMPRCNGERLCRELKRDPGTAGIPVIMMTGGPTDEARMRDAGCAGVIYKPLSDSLTELLMDAIEGRLLVPATRPAVGGRRDDLRTRAAGQGASPQRGWPTL